MNLKSLLISTGLLFLLNACSTFKKTYVSPSEINQVSEQLPNEELSEVLYLIGDAGNPHMLEEDHNYLFEHLGHELAQESENSSIVFLGDNIYPAGLPSKKKSNRSEAEAVLDEQLDIVENFLGDAYFIPGNHDWNHWKSGGIKALERQEKYVQEYYEDEKNKVRFHPNDGCGDPVVTKISKDLYYIFIDSQWWLHNWELEKHINKGCSIKSRQEFVQRLQELFLIHKNDQLVVMMHHPLFSNSEHGGKFSFKTHLFPLTEVNKYAWLPLPILGSMYPINRSLGASRQDISHPLYQELKDEILGMLTQNKNVIFASGHDHNLQYFNESNQHFIVSGSGSKVTFAKEGGKAEMVRAANGYSKLHFYKNGEVWMDFLVMSVDSSEAELIFRKQIVAPRAGTVDYQYDYPDGDMLQDSIYYAANPDFAAKKFKKFLLGKQYRSTWTTPVKAPVLNFESEKGGIFPVKKGGGMASNSLRVENFNEEQYALRSIKKDYTRLFGAELSNLKAINIMEDLNSASHPYAPLTLPALSKASNIYYTIPKLVYLKKQDGLGNYNELFEEELYLLEDRPEGDRTEFDHLGNSDEIISYLDLLELKMEDNTIQIDQEWTLRSRLFDIWIHDWDRHDDQWRWAKIEEDGEEFYRPIPRDRDQAFYKFEGLLPGLVAYFGVRKFKNFKGNVKDVKYQSFNARYFDRYFLHELEWKDWEKEILYLQTYLTDEVIDEALKELPPEVYDLSAQEIKDKLISRRRHLMEIGAKLYDYISKNVSIPGSNEDERFELKRKDDGSVEVQVFNLSKKGKKKDKLYERTFEKNETNEIRLYGLGGQDEFSIKGKTKKSILVRVIGGFGKDEIKDKSKVAGLSKMTKVYDEKNGIKIKAGKEVRDLTGPDIEENDYDRKDHEYNKHSYMPNVGYTPDDNLWLGLNAASIIHGFRKEPYKSKHQFGFLISPSTRNAFNVKYESDFNTVLFNYLDVNIGVQIDNPLYQNYFGLGNNSVLTTNERRFNWVRLSNYQAHFSIKKSWLNDRFSVYAGPKYTNWSVMNVSGRVLDGTALTPAAESFETKHYFGGQAGFNIDNRDNKVFPTNGVMLSVAGNMFRNIENTNTINSISAEQTFYITFGRKLFTTFASRTGWSRAGGDLEFYNYPTLGNRNYLRGYRNDRFRGNHIFYQNIDLRVKLFNWQNNVLPMKVGVVGGYDVGRVWLNNENINQLHHGYTAGLWFNVLNVVVLQPHFSISKEEKQFNFRMGFNF